MVERLLAHHAREAEAAARPPAPAPGYRPEVVDPIEVVGGLSETTQWVAALIARDLGLPYAAPEVVRYSRDKYAMRELLRGAGLDDTPSRVVRDHAEIAQFAAETGFRSC